MADHTPNDPEIPSLGAAVDNLSEGTNVFDRYTLMKVVGRGPASVVWHAWDERLGRDAALKFLPEVLHPEPSTLAKFKSDIRKIQEMKHAHLVPLDNVEMEGALVALASDYVEGASFCQLLAGKREKVFAPSEIADWLYQICEVLDFMHNEGGIPHGAVRPSNILLDHKGFIRLTDFGQSHLIARFVAATSDFKDPELDLRYASPHSAQGEPVGVLDDIYALGATLYELLTSKPPFYTGNLLRQLEQKVPPPMTHRRKELRVIGEAIPRVWEETVASCLAKDPQSRPQSVIEIINALELHPSETATAPVEEETLGASTEDGNRTMVIAGGVGFMIIAVVAAVYMTFSGGKKQQEPVLAQVVVSNVVPAAATIDPEIEAKLLAAEQARLAAEAEAQKLIEEARRLKEEQEKAAAAAEKAREEAEREMKAAEAERQRAEQEKQRLMEEARKATMLAAEQQSEEAERLRKEAEAKLKAAEIEAERMVKDAERIKAEQTAKAQEMEKARLQAMQATTNKEEEAKRKAQEVERERMRLQELERIRMANEARVAELAKAESIRKQEEEAKKLAAQQAAETARLKELEEKRFKPGQPWSNSLAVRLVPFGSIYAAVTELRVSEFEQFVREKRYTANRSWRSPGIDQTESHPVVNVSWADAQAFCQWLTEKEVKEQILPVGAQYRLPTDVEWSRMVGLANDSGGTARERAQSRNASFPWGKDWPPVIGAGNYANRVTFDAFDGTSPSASFLPDGNGIFDLGGNVWEWCQDDESGQGILRGGGWKDAEPSLMLSHIRRFEAKTLRATDVGIRLVLQVNAP